MHFDNSNFILREANDSDSCFIEKVKLLTSPDVIPNSMLWDDDEHRDRVLGHSYAAVIIQIEGVDVGFFQLAYSKIENHLMQIRLLPEWQGKGIGSKLIAALQALCAKSKTSISLHVYTDNRALRLYCGLGFEVVKSDGAAYLMRWKPST